MTFQELAWLIPPALLPWLGEWGVFLGILGILFALTTLGLRKFFLWRRGTMDILVYLKRLTELQEKSLLELELLNKALRAPLKKAQGSPPPEGPREVPLKERENLLAALRAAKGVAEANQQKTSQNS